jgi:hypothetical protein
MPVVNLRQAGDKMFASSLFSIHVLDLRSNLISSPSCVPIDHSLLFSALDLAGKAISNEIGKREPKPIIGTVQWF